MVKWVKYIVVIAALVCLLWLWNWVDKNDYFNSNYNELTAIEADIFNHNKKDGESLAEVYKKHLSDTAYQFPRQKVFTIKCFRNIAAASILTSKTLKPEYNGDFIQFCNEPSNFNWNETTWNLGDAEYFFRLYDADDKVVGKIFFCLKDCGMSKAKPFCPSMKFGGLSEIGRKKMQGLIDDKNKWG